MIFPNLMKKALFILSLVLSCLSSQAQLKDQLVDSLHMEVGTNVTAASKDYLPLWLVANRFGVISDRKFDASTNFRATTSLRFGEEYSSVYGGKDKGYYMDLGVDLYNNSHFGKVLIQEAYVKIRHRGVMFRAGSFKQIIGEVDPDLSSGSLGVSGNALPIPRISFALDYTDIPFTNGFLQFKGHISHGWMGNDQYLKKAFLHEKTFYGRIGNGKFRAYAGIQHYAVWGGGRADAYDGKYLDRSLKGFLDVLLVKEANDGTVPDGILPNRAGDHRGVIEAGVQWEDDNMLIQLNHQTPFEMGQGIDPRNIDRLASLNFVNKNSESWFSKLTLEFIYTKQMNDFYSLIFRESYYNNGVYKTGWEYRDHIIGTPLFTNRQRASKYFNSIVPYNWDVSAEENNIAGLDNIINNRVVGGHLGLALNFTEKLRSITKITYTKNYGDYRRNSVFAPSKDQFYCLYGMYYKMPNERVTVNLHLAYDWGQLSKNFGSMIGVTARL